MQNVNMEEDAYFAQELALVDLGDRDEQFGCRTTIANDEGREVIEQLLFGELL